MSRILEAIFQQFIRLLLLLVLLPAFSILIAYIVTPRTYASSASLWALHRYTVVGDTTVEPNPPPTPADTQVAALSALLQTRNFDLSIANQSGLVTTLDKSISTNPQLRDNAMIGEIAKHVIVASQGDNLFTINYANRDPQIAQRVVAATIQSFGLQTTGLARLQGQDLLDNYQQQLAAAAQDVDAAVARETQYLSDHPASARNILYAGPEYAQLFDPEYGNLHTQTQQALSRLQQIQNQMATIQLQIAAQGSDANTLYKVVDAPLVASLPEGRSKTFLIAGGAALGIALLACILYIIITVRSDHALYTTREIYDTTAYPVVMRLPHLNSKNVPRLVVWSIQNGHDVGKG